jgi:hypothetical protein
MAGDVAAFHAVVAEVMSLPLESLAHVIQASIAPVVLLAALGTVLSVLTLRLARIVDRMRGLDLRIRGYHDGPPVSAERREHMRYELGILRRRRWFTDCAIICCTLAALIVCLVIAIAFAAYISKADVGFWLAILFILSMVAFICALVLFLCEVVFAAYKMRREIG